MNQNLNLAPDAVAPCYLPRYPMNIERSGFRRGEYVGYADGAWRITRGGLGWVALKQTAPCRLTAPTLALLSVALENHIPTAVVLS